MTRIIFMRHGPAGDRETFPGDDDQRPLTEAGMQEVRLVADAIMPHLVAKAATVNIVTSSLVRAKMTADIVEESITRTCAKDQVILRHETSGLGHDATWVDWLDFWKPYYSDLAPKTLVIAIGHEPSISRIVAGFLNISPKRIPFKKSGIAVLRLKHVARAKLLAFLPPRYFALARTDE